MIEEYLYLLVQGKLSIFFCKEGRIQRCRFKGLNQVPISEIDDFAEFFQYIQDAYRSKTSSVIKSFMFDKKIEVNVIEEFVRDGFDNLVSLGRELPLILLKRGVCIDPNEELFISVEEETWQIGLKYAQLYAGEAKITYKYKVADIAEGYFKALTNADKNASRNGRLSDSNYGSLDAYINASKV